MDKTKITCIVGNLIKQTDCDAFVNSVNPSMLAGSGVCGVIHRAADNELEVYGNQFAPLELNQAVITPGFDLDIKQIIHVSAPRHYIAADPLRELADALRNVFILAEEHKIHKIALPAIGTGVYAYPMIEAVGVYTSVSMEFLKSEILEEIRFVFTKSEPMYLMKSALNRTVGF